MNQSKRKKPSDVSFADRVKNKVKKKMYSVPSSDDTTIIEHNLFFSIDFNEHKNLATQLKCSAQSSVIDEDGNTLLLRALVKKSKECAEFLLKIGCYPDVRNKRNETPLHWACIHKFQDIVIQLLSFNIDANVSCVNGFVPLHCAIRSGSAQIVELLLEYSVDINIPTNEGITPLMLAISDNNISIAQLLLQKNVNIHCVDIHKRTALHFACLSGNHVLISDLIDNSSNTNKKDEHGESPLHYIIKSTSANALKYFISLDGIDINISDNFGFTPLHTAISNGNYKLVKILLESNQINIHKKNRQGITVLDIACISGSIKSVSLICEYINEIIDPTPLHLAIINGHFDIISLLLNKSPNLWQIKTKKKKENAIHIAARVGRGDIIKLLCDKFKNDVNLNIKNYHGNTPLHIASMYGKELCVKYLIDNNCDLNIKNNFGQIPLHYVIFKSNEALVKLFLLKLSNRMNKIINIQDNDGNTFLHIVSCIPIVQKLLEYKSINPTIVNKNGWTALECSTRKGFFPVSFLLIRHLQSDLEYCNIYKNLKLNGESITQLISVINPKLWKASLVSYPLLPDISNYQAENEWGMTPLISSAKNRNIRSIKYLLNNCLKSININHQDKYGWTALHYASAKSYDDCVSELLKFGANRLLQDKKGRIPLHISRKMEIYELLLTENTNEQCRVLDNKGNLPLHILCKIGNSLLLSYLLQYDIFDNENDIDNYLQNNNASPLHIACFYNRISCVKYLIAKMPHVDLNLIDPICNTTPLIISIKNNNSDIVGLLTNSPKLRVNYSTDEGITPLHIAAEVGNASILSKLIDKNANVSFLDNKNELALHKALSNNNIECAIVLIRANSPLTESVKTFEGLTVLLHGANIGNIYICLNVLHNHYQYYDKKNSKGQTILHLATINGNLHCTSELIHIIEDNSFINNIDNYGKTALHYAAELNRFEIVAFLVVNGADIHMQCNELGNTPLHYASKHSRCYKFLIDHGASDNVINNKQVTPRQLFLGTKRGLRPVSRMQTSRFKMASSLSNGWVKAVKTSPKVSVINLQDNKRKIMKPKKSFVRVDGRKNSPDKTMNKNQIGLSKSILKNDLDNFSKYLSKLKSSNLNYIDADGNTPLISSIDVNNIQMVSQLLNAKANPNFKNNRGENALFTSINNKLQECISLLLMNNSDPNIVVGDEKETVLSLAASQGNHKLIHQLISFNASVDKQQGIMGHTALYIATIGGHVSSIKALLLHGASVNILSKNNFLSPLHAACINGKTECVKFLLEQQAQVDLRTLKNCTPLHLTINRNTIQKVGRILLEYNGDINALDEENKTPLHYACLYDSLDDVKFLLNCNKPANTNIYDSSQNLPIHIAAKIGNLDIVSALIKADPTSILKEDKDKRIPLHISCFYCNFEVSVYLYKKMLSYKNIIDKNGLIIVKDSFGNTPLYYAIEKNRVDICAMLLGVTSGIRRQTVIHRSTINNELKIGDFYKLSINTLGQTVLHKLIEFKLKNCLEIILKKINNISNTEDLNGESLLLLACRIGYSDIISLLLTYGASISKTTDNGYTCLELAIKSKDINTVTNILTLKPETVLEYNSKNGCNVLHWICESTCNSITLFSLLKSLPIDPPCINSTNNDKQTPLMIACKHNNYNCVEYILNNYKVTLNKVDNKSQSAYLYATHYSDIKIINLLENNNILLTQKDLNGLSALLSASSGGNEKVILHLLKTKPNNFKITETDQFGNLPLHLAVNSGSLNSCKILLHEKLINFKNKKGESPLHFAANTKNYNIMKYLIDNKAKIDIQDNNGITPAHICSKINFLKGFLLIPNNFINLKTFKGRTPLHFASRYNNKDIVEYLIKKNIKLEYDNQRLTPLHFASLPSIINILISSFKNIELSKDNQGRLPIHFILTNIESEYTNECMDILLKGNPNSLNAKSKSYKTPLHYACISGISDCVQFLIENGATIEDIDFHGISPLLYATMLNNTECVEILLDSGANVNRISKDFFTCLHKAVELKNITLIRLLLDYGANINIKNKYGNTALHIACYLGFEDGVELLIQNKANLTALNNKGLTPLELWLYLSNDDKVKTNNIIYIFFKNGFDIKYINTSNGLHLIHLCSFYGKIHLIKLFLGLECDIDLSDLNYGMTVTMYAALGGHLSILEYLKSQGANLLLKSNNGQTCLHFAVKSGDISVVSWLLESEPSLEHEKDNNNLTALQFAAMSGYYEITELLLKGLIASGGDIYKLPDSKGFYSTHWACFISSLSLFKELLNRGCSINWKTNNTRYNILQCLLLRNKYNNNEKDNEINRITMLKELFEYSEINEYIGIKLQKYNDSIIHLASKLNDKLLLQVIINKYKTLNIKWNINDVNNVGCSILHYAIISNSYIITEYLISTYKPNINLLDNHGNSCVMKAISTKSSNIIKLLFSQKELDIYISNKNNESVLHYACYYGYLPIVKKIFNEKPNIFKNNLTWKTKLGETPLHYAIAGGNTSIITFLLISGISIVEKDIYNMDSLFYGVFNYNNDVLNLLLTKYPTSKPLEYCTYDVYTGMNALHIACYLGKISCLLLLLKYFPTALTISTKSKQYTLLHLAVQHGHLNIVEYLLTCSNINRNTTDSDNKTPLMLSKEYNYPAITKLLQQTD